MKRYFILLLLFAGIFAVSCGSGYQVASSEYDDATYFRPDVTARVHLLATAEEAEDLKNQTIAQARKEGAKVETVYTDPEGVANINVEPGTTYLIMNSQDDSYASRLEKFSDEPSDSFSLTINMDFGYDYWWANDFFSYPWYGPWVRYRYWYMPYSYWNYWYWYPRSWYRDFWYYDWCYNSWYYPSYYYMWSYSGIWGIYPYEYYYYHGNYDSHNRINPRENLRRVAPEDVIASRSVRSGGSYRRTNPQIDQISGNRNERVADVESRNNNPTESGTRYYRRINETTGSEAVYRRDHSSETRSRSEQTNTGNSFYRRSSNLSQRTPDNSSTESTTRTTNPGNSRSFYRRNQEPSTTVNTGNSGSSRTVRNNTNTRSTSGFDNRSYNRSSSSSSVSRSSGTSRSTNNTGSMRSSSSSMGSGTSSSSGSVSRSGSSGGSYRR
jgi:hypothetical protein